MPLPSSIQSFTDCIEFMEKAIDDDKGARYECKTEAAAQFWRLRCNTARELDRKQNKIIHEPGHKMHGCSLFDQLMFTIVEDVEGGWWCYARVMKLEESRVELLSEVEDDE